MSPGKLEWADAAFPDGLPLPPLTKSDDDFAALGVEFVEDADSIDLSELNDLFGRVGFPRRDRA